jgi:pyrimidine operon attenuation protein/uracil phosphoribosyltransferase
MQLFSLACAGWHQAKAVCIYIPSYPNLKRLAMEKLILDKVAIDELIAQISGQIIKQNQALDQLGLVGIRTKGKYLARLIASFIEQHQKIKLPVGTIDTTLYRDDVSVSSHRPVLCHTEIPFDVANKKIILVDDVLYTGRTIRAALDALMDLGRPKAIELAVLIDRGHRELPIRANYVGYEIATTNEETIKLVIDQNLNYYKVILSKESTAKKW